MPIDFIVTTEFWIGLIVGSFGVSLLLVLLDVVLSWWDERARDRADAAAMRLFRDCDRGAGRGGRE